MATPETKEQYIKELTRLLGNMWDAAYAAGSNAQLTQILATFQKTALNPFTPKPIAGAESPQKRGARDRAGHGVIKKTVQRIISGHHDGISRPEIVRYAAERYGVTIKEGSLKQAIRILKAEKAIRNQDRKWFPAQPSGQEKPGGDAPGQLDILG